MPEKPDASRSSSAPGASVDDRPRALGLGRLVMVAFWGVGLWLTGAALADLFTHGEGPRGPEILALVAGVVYLLAALALTHNGRRMRIIGWACIGATIAAPILFAVAGVGLPQLAEPRSAWTGFGSDFFYLPLLVSVIGCVWMWYSNPRRIVEIAEQVERPIRSLRGSSEK